MSNFYQKLRTWGVACAMTVTTGLYAQSGTLTVEVKDITDNDATVVITPSSDDLMYYWGLSSKTDFESKGGADKAVENRINIWKEEASYWDDTTWQEAMSWDLKSGVVNELASERFDPLPTDDYVVYAFGMDAQGEISAPLVIKEFTNKPAPAYTLTVEVTDITDNDARVIVTPSSDDLKYYWGLSSKTVFESKGGADKAVENRINIWKEEASNWDITWQEAMSWDLKSGVVNELASERFDALDPDDYVVYAFGMNEQGEVSAPLVLKEFTNKATPTYTLTVDVKDITENDATVVVTPSSDELKYCWSLSTKSNFEAMGGAENIIANRIDSWKAMADMISIPWQQVMGMDLTSGAINQLASVRSGALNGDYVLYAFGMDAQGEVSAPLAFKEFSTVSAPKPSYTLTVEVKDITENDATVVITPSSDELKYCWSLSTKSNFEAMGGAENIIANRIDSWKTMADMMSIPWQQVMGMDLTSGAINQLASVRSGALNGDYVLYAFGMDAQGEVSAPLAFKEFSTKSTPAPAYTLTLELKDEQLTDATLVITPSSDELKYYWGMSTKQKFEAEGGVDKVVENRIQVWKNNTAYFDKTTWQEVMSWDLKSGSLSEKLSEKFEIFPDNDYVIYAFGMDAQGELSAPVTTVEYSSVAAIHSDNTFTLNIVSVQPDNTQRMNVKAKVTPTNNDKYTVRIVAKKYLEKYDFTPGSASEKDFINDYMLYYLSDSNTYSGEQTVTFPGQTADDDYTLFVIGIDRNNAPSTDLYKLDFRTERFPLHSIKLEVNEVTPMNAHIKVTPSDPDMRYYMDICPKSIIEDKGGESNIAEKLIIDWWKYIAELYENQYPWTDFIEPQTRTGSLDTYVADMVKDGLLSNQYWNDEWALYAVGFSLDGEVLTEPAVVYYTAPSPGESDLTFEVELVSAEKDETVESRYEPYTATLNIKPSRVDEEYKVNYTRKSTFDAWVYNEIYGMEDFIKSQWMENAVSFTDNVILKIPQLDRYQYDGSNQTYTLMAMGWNEGPTTEPTIVDIYYDAFTGLTVSKADGVRVIGGENRITVAGQCENVVVYSAAGQIMGTLRSAGSLNVPAGIYVVRCTQEGKPLTTKVVVR